MNRFCFIFHIPRSYVEVEHQAGEGEDGLNIYASRGDTLAAYGEWFAVPYELLLDANPHIRKDRLDQGEVVCIPGYETIGTWEALAHFFLCAKKRCGG